MFDRHIEGLEIDAPSDDFGHKAGFDPYQIAVVCFDDERFAHEQILQFFDTKENRVRFLLNGRPTSCCTTEFMRQNCNDLFLYNASRRDIFLVKYYTTSSSRSIGS
jgi:hypothetical protein